MSHRARVVLFTFVALAALLSGVVPVAQPMAEAAGLRLSATQVASALPGAVSWLYYADRLYQLPLGFIAVAMGTVLLPEIARCVREDDRDSESAVINRACELALLITLPAAACRKSATSARPRNSEALAAILGVSSYWIASGGMISTAISRR